MKKKENQPNRPQGKIEKKKKNEKRDKYLALARELKKIWEI